MNALNVIETAVPDRVDPAERPGQHLQRERQSRGLELERVATQLHLRKDVVDALEQGRYDELPAPVYVAGYLRNYARLLEVDAEPLLQAYYASTRSDVTPPVTPAPLPVAEPELELPTPAAAPLELTPAPTPELPPAPVIIAPAAPQSPPPIVLPTFAHPAAEPAITAPRSNTTLLLIVGALLPVLALGWYFRADLAPTLFESAVEQTAEDAAPSQLPPIQNEAEEATAAASATAPAVVAPAPAPSEAAPAAAVASTAPAPDAGAETTAPAAIAPLEVTLEFMSTAWLSVTGGNGRTVLTGKIREGERRVLTGQPPYQFIIGKANAVKVTVNGEPFDVMTHARGNVARFTLPLAPAPAADAATDSATATTSEYD